MTDIDRYLTDEVVEKAAKTMADDWDPDRYPVLATMFRDYARTALAAVLPDIIQQAKAEAWDEGYAEGSRGRMWGGINPYRPSTSKESDNE